jgi:hypothetical protein
MRKQENVWLLLGYINKESPVLYHMFAYRTRDYARSRLKDLKRVNPDRYYKIKKLWILG